MKWLVLILLLLAKSSYSSDVKGKLIFNSDPSTLVTGEVLSAKLLLWPYLRKDESAFYGLEGKAFLSFFYVPEVLGVERSKNNEEVVEINLNLIPVKKFRSNGFFIFNYDDLNIPIEVPQVEVIETKLSRKDFALWSHSHEPKKKSSFWLFLITFFIVVFVTLIFCFLKKKKKDNKDTVNNDPENLRKKILAAVKREDYEEIYKDREVLKKIINEDESKSISEFLSCMEKHQYKKKWYEKEKEDVRLITDKLKELI